MKIIERLFQYIDYKGIKHTRFEKEIGLSNGYLNTQLKRKADLGEGIITKIIDNCLDINVTWFITGKGNMINNENGNLKGNLKGNLIDEKSGNTDPPPDIGELQSEVERLRKENAALKESNDDKKLIIDLLKKDAKLAELLEKSGVFNVAAKHPSSKSESKLVETHK